MTFDELLEQAIAMLQRRGRVSYRALKRQFALDDAYLEDLRRELIEVHRVAVDHDGTMLVWTGDPATALPPMAHPTPPHAPTPLFVEELTKTVLESRVLTERQAHYELAGPLPPLAIPATPQGALLARLDRLSTVKTVAQLGATIGRAFPYEILQAVASLDEAMLQQGLRQLVEAELVYQRGLIPQTTYTFKHALIQDAAYQSLLRSTRQQYHQRIAKVMESRFPEVVEAQPELLAQQVVHAPSLAYAFAWAAQLHVYCQEAHAVQQWAEAMVALANEHGFALWVAFGTLLRGWALARQGQHTEGIPQIHSGLSAWLATGTAISRPLGLTLLAEAYGMAGQIDKALATVTEALAVVDTSREFIWEANLHRLRGELLLVRARDQQAEAEACFQQARAVACSAGEISGTARRHQPGPPVAAAGQTPARLRPAGTGVCLVHRGI